MPSEELRNFLDASAADIAFLRLARDALVSHPKISPGVHSPDSALCRTLVITAVTAIDRVLELWRGADFIVMYDSQRGSDGKKVENGERIRLLEQCFTGSGVVTDPDVISDFLAIKYLRNAFAHIEWKNKQRPYIEERGFPTELSRLSHVHWNRILFVCHRMLDYVSQAAFSTAITIDDHRLHDMIDVQISFEPSNRNQLVSYLLHPNDVPTAFWRNLEKLDIWARNELATQGTDFARLGDLASSSWETYKTAVLSQLNQPVVNGTIKLFDTLRAQSIYPMVSVGVDLSALAKQREKVQEVGAQRGMNPTALTVIQKAFEKICTVRTSKPHGQLHLWSEEIDLEIAVSLCPLFVRDLHGVSATELMEALRVGCRAYRALPNRAPLDLFAKTLPQFDVGRRSEYLAVAREILGLFMLRTSWYAWVESTEAHPHEPPIDLWREFEIAICSG